VREQHVADDHLHDRYQPVNRLALVAALLLAAAFSVRADEVDAIAQAPWTYLDGSALTAITYKWQSGCVRSGQYERPVESSADAGHTYKGLPDAVCYLRVSAVDAKGVESPLSDNEIAWDGAANRVLPPTPTQPPRGTPTFALVPTPAWQTSDIGSPALAGSFADSAGTISLQGAGADIWGTSDQFRYAYRPSSGDVEIVARVAGLGNTDPWAKAGVMVREGTQPGSRYVFMLVTPGRGVDLQWRAATNQSAQQALSDMTTRPPRWVRLTRTGNVFRGYHSADGVAWMLYSMQTIAMPADALIGLAVTSHNTAALATAAFTDVRVVE
jgi:regulation of enolase protein 1 (concanavalin A-like superfamily)